jgi:hypothetical protein
MSAGSGCGNQRAEQNARAAPAVAYAPAASAPRVEPASPPSSSSQSEPREPVAALVLPIPARTQAAESPSAGWCGETAIQEALLFLGVWASQRVVNRAGSPIHPDLYATELPQALTALGVHYTLYAPPQRGYAPFARWIEGALAQGDPVLAGAKLLPTQHPEWGLDHFVLVVGHGSPGLLVNTTWGGRAWVSDGATKGISFKNAFYAIRLTGRAVTRGASPARLRVEREDASGVKLAVSCPGVHGAAEDVRIEQHADKADGALAWSTAGAVAERTISADHAAYFQCVTLAR